jgi:hypothetical protein
MRIVMLPQQECLSWTIALLWLTTRKQPGNFCRTRQTPAHWRERRVAGILKNLQRNQSIESESAAGTALA